MEDWKTAIEAPLPSIAGRTLDESRVYTPQRRPLYPMLTIVDDQSSADGEVVRIRKDSLSIGRSEGDLTFPAEALMSSMHARISLQKIRSDRWVWALEDLQSRHGLFLKLPAFEIQPGNEFIMGGTKFLMNGECPVARVSSKPLLEYEPYIVEPNALSRSLSLKITSYSVAQPEMEIPVTGRGLKLGRLVSGPGLVEGDPFLEPHHATLLRNSDGSWKITDQKSLNGLWLRIRSAIISQPTFFLVGEQRFRFN